MRELHDHKVNEANEQLVIKVLDAAGSGGASHLYEISGFNVDTNPSSELELLSPEICTAILFQNGPIAEAGVNGVTHEALLAILVDRMRSFQAGPYACRENALALTKLEEAQHWLQARTRSRLARGVEGTHKV